jgi:RES domain-containing protein
LILYRFARPDYATRELAFAGKGGLKYAGRWNNAGALIVYTSTTLSLAGLEILVHTRRLVPNSWPLFVADVPDPLIEKLSPAGPAIAEVLFLTELIDLRTRPCPYLLGNSPTSR